MILNFFDNNIFIDQAISEHPWACLSACQNLAKASYIYPLPVMIFTWLKGT